jgi:hypothetical protein
MVAADSNAANETAQDFRSWRFDMMIPKFLNKTLQF